MSRNADDLPSLIRLAREENFTSIGQLSADDLTDVFADNQQIHDILKGTCYEGEADDLLADMEALKYFLWLGPERCGMFFARQVLLVEGQTERCLVNHLFDSGQLEMPKGGVFVLDCLGKFNMHRFVNILGPLSVYHSVLFDADRGKPPHDKLKKVLLDSRNAFTRKIDFFLTDLEDFLGIPPAGKAHRKPQHVMLKLQQGAIGAERLEELVKMVTALISIGPPMSTGPKSTDAMPLSDGRVIADKMQVSAQKRPVAEGA